MQASRTSLASASRGQALLKRKAEALFHRLCHEHALLVAAKTTSSQHEEGEAAGLVEGVARAHRALMHYAVEETVGSRWHANQIEICSKSSPTMHLHVDSDGTFSLSSHEFNPNIPLGARLAKTHWVHLIYALVDVANRQARCQALQASFLACQQRANALESVVVPELESRVHRITEQLEEAERDELFRVKRVLSRPHQ